MSEYPVVLLAYAEVAATLTGFIGVVFVFDERSRRLGSDRPSALFHLMYASLSALFLSLFATLLLEFYAPNEQHAWRICNGISGAIHLFGAGRLALETLRHQTDLLRSGASSTIGLGTAAVSFIAAAGYFATNEQALIFMLATLWILAVTVIAFLSLLISASGPGDSAAAEPRDLRN